LNFVEVGSQFWKLEYLIKGQYHETHQLMIYQKVWKISEMLRNVESDGKSTQVKISPDYTHIITHVRRSLPHINIDIPKFDDNKYLYFTA
jgi:hypothetical protein